MSKKKQVAPVATCKCGKMVPFPPEVLVGDANHTSWWVVHNAQREYKSEILKYARGLCKDCDFDAVLEVIRGDMKLDQPIMKLASGLTLMAEGYEGPYVTLKIGSQSVNLTNSAIQQLREALDKAEIWNEFGDAPGMK